MENQNPGLCSRGNSLIDYYVRVFRTHWWKIIGVSMLSGLGLLIILLFLPNRYTAKAVISPSPEQRFDEGAFPNLGPIGAFVGTAGKVEDIEAVFQSGDLSVRVFRKNNLWPVVFGEDFDPKTGKLRVGLIDRIRGEKGEYYSPGDWDAIRAAEDYLSISTNRKFGHLTISFESFSPEWAAKITGYYLDEAKDRLQEEAIAKARNNKKFIEEQIRNTVDAITKDRLFNIYSKEVEKEMLARNREHFAFKIIDAPKVPDRRSGPRRLILSTLMSLLVFMLSTIYYSFRES